MNPAAHPENSSVAAADCQAGMLLMVAFPEIPLPQQRVRQVLHVAHATPAVQT
jgi:hypothetical protein